MGDWRRMLVISNWYANPEFLPLHAGLLEAQSADPLTYVAVIDAPRPAVHVRAAEENGIRHVVVDQGLHRARREVMPFCHHDASDAPSDRAAVSNQVAWNELVRKPRYRGIVFFVQSDIFPFTPYSGSGLLRRATLAGRHQVRGGTEYLWDGFLLADTRSWEDSWFDLFSLEGGLQKSAFTDVGGATWRICEAVGWPKVRRLPWLNSGRWTLDDPVIGALPEGLRSALACDPRNRDGALFAEATEAGFFHVRAMSNWDGYDAPSIRAALYEECFRQLLDGVRSARRAASELRNM